MGADALQEVHDRLKPIASAFYDSSIAPTGCLDGTRVAIQTELRNWANNGAQELTTLWLNGMAGTGKTTIASTFARNIEQEGILGATFFIDRQQEERQDLCRIVQTLAYDLAKNNHEQLRAVWTVLRDDPTFERLSYEKQVHLLIKKPLDIVRPETQVILIDGLDECGALKGASLLSTLVTSLVHHPIKLFVASRNETDIVKTLRGIPHTPIELQAIGVAEDVQLYWEHNLDELCGGKLLPDWRSTVSLKELVELTGHLFIYATTILEIILDTRANPITELRELLDISRSGTEAAMAFDETAEPSPLEKLYIHIISEAVRDKRGKISTKYALRLHDILEIIIFAREPLPPQALSDLLGMDRVELDAYLSPLRSVLVIPDATSSDGVVRPLHQSFPDFVRQQGHVVHSKLALDVAFAHKNMVQHCLVQLNKLSHYDMFDIKDASLSNLEAFYLTPWLERLPARFSYSARYWPVHLLDHLRAAGSQAQLPQGLTEFCGQHLLHWIEVLSLTRSLNDGQQMIPQLISVMNVRIFYSRRLSGGLTCLLDLPRLERPRNTCITG
jgi:hypothetical protein